MRIIRTIFYFLFWPFLLMSCAPGYKKENGRWTYITYDEGNGKNVKYIDTDDTTFQILSDRRYAKDKARVFFEGNPIASAESMSFHLISGDYAADNNQVYLRNYAVIDADPKTFKRIKSYYARDHKHIFSGTIPMIVNDPEHFKVTYTTDSYGIKQLSLFISEHPAYARIDTTKYDFVVYGFDKAETLTEKFEGYKKKN